VSYIEDVEQLESPNLAAFPWLLHAFTTRLAGDFRMTSPGPNSADRASEIPGAWQGVSPVLAVAAREKFKLAWARQVHSADVVEVVHNGDELEYRLGGRDAGAYPERADALITGEPAILLSIRVADCLPVLMVDPRRRAIAAVHAGWRGALHGIAKKALDEMHRVYDCRAEDVLVALGPSIRACCYEVGEDVVTAFRSRFKNAEAFFRPRRIPQPQPLNPSVCLDLVAAVRDQLEDAGVLPSQINVLDFCTSCRTELFFSYRRDRASAGRMMALIAMRA
jgi:polyphenol oxidase